MGSSANLALLACLYKEAHRGGRIDSYIERVIEGCVSFFGIERKVANMAGVAARAQPLLYHAKGTRRRVVAGLAQLPQPCKK